MQKNLLISIYSIRLFENNHDKDFFLMIYKDVIILTSMAADCTFICNKRKIMLLFS